MARIAASAADADRARGGHGFIMAMADSIGLTVRGTVMRYRPDDYAAEP